MSDVIAVVPDLFFAVRIQGTARALGVDLRTLRAEAALRESRDDPPRLVIVDLTARHDPIGLIRALKELHVNRPIRVIGFYPHVERGLREAALAAGADEVLPRSAFTAQLATLLGGERGTAPGTGLLHSAAGPASPTASAPMKNDPSSPPAPRVRISCPGCGRNDYVRWPENEPVYHWKCFNCGKEFDLTREGSH